MNSKVTLNYFYNLIYQFLAIALPILTVPYVSRVLGPAQLGNYYYVTAIVTYFGIFAAMGTVDYGQREIAKRQENIFDRSKMFWDILWFRQIFVLLTFVCYLIIINFFSIKYRALFFANIFMFFSYSIDVSWYFQGVEDFKVTALRNGLVKILATILIFILVKNPSDVLIYTLIYAVAAFLGNLTMIPYLRNEICFVKVDIREIFSHFRGILSLFLPVVAIQLYTVLNRIMLGALSTSTQVGYFSQIITVINLAITIISAFAAVLTPHIANLHVNGKLNEVKQYSHLAIGYVYLLGIPMIIGCLAIGDIFVPVFFGKGYEPAVPLLWILSILFIVLGLGQLLGPFLIAIDRQKGYTIAVSSAAIVNLALNFYFLGLFKEASIGVAIATIIAELCSTLLEIYFLRDILNLKDFINLFIKYLLCCIPMIIGILCIRVLIQSSFLVLILSILLAVLLYFAVLLLIKDPIFYSMIGPILTKLKK